MAVGEALVAEGLAGAIAEWAVCSFLPLGVLTIGSNVGACWDASIVESVGLVTVVVEVPTCGAHVEGDDSGFDVESLLHLVLMMYLVQLDRLAASGCCSSALGVGGILAVGLHHVVLVLHGEGQKTCCRW